MTHESGVSESQQSSLREYFSDLHLPIVAVLFTLCCVLGAIGFNLRPGTDEPPAVSDAQIQISVYQGNSNSPLIAPSGISIDETLIQKTSSTVQLQINLF